MTGTRADAPGVAVSMPDKCSGAGKGPETE